MYRIADIVEGLRHLVGWEQHWDSGQQIDSSLTETESGLYFQDAHPMLTLDNMRSVMPAEWTDGFDQFLEKITRAGIVKAVQTFISRKVSGHESRNLLERRNLFDGVGRYRDTIEGRGAFVGFEISPVHSGSISIRLDRIGLQMKGAEGTVRVYLFRTSQEEPVWYKDVTFTSGAGAFVWLTLGADAPVIAPAVPGEKWYLGYHQSLLPKWMDAVNYSRDWSKPPCMQCNRGSVRDWEDMNRFFHVTPFMADAEVHEASFDYSFSHAFAVEKGDDEILLWDPDRMVYMPATNWGIDFTYTVGCDLTDFIVSQRSVFSEVVQKQVAYDALKALALNPDVRVNRNQLNAAQLLTDLDGAPGMRTGLARDLESAYKALSVDLKGLDPICLGCRNKGVRYGQA